MRTLRMSKPFYDSLSEITKLRLISNSINSDLEARITKRNIPKDIASNLKSKFVGQR